MLFAVERSMKGRDVDNEHHLQKMEHIRQCESVSYYVHGDTTRKQVTVVGLAFQ